MKKILLFIYLCRIGFLSNAQVWSKLDFGFMSGSTIEHIKTIDSILYLSGSFSFPQEYILNKIAKWDGANLDTLFSVMKPQTGYPLSMIKFNNKIIVGGDFHKISETSYQIGIPNTKSIAVWDGAEWSALGNGGVEGFGSVRSFCICNDDLYIGGGFISSGGLNNLNCIARWDGTNWNNVGAGFQGTGMVVRAMAVYNDKLYLGGTFSKAGNIPAFNIAGWDGTQYFDLDTGVLGDVHSLLVDSVNNLLYVGGGINHVGGNGGYSVPGGIVRWDGFRWEIGGNNVSLNKGTTSLVFYRNEIYSGTYGVTGNYLNDTILTRFDGNQWHRVEGPITTILTLGVFNDELYTGGGQVLTTSGDTAWGAARYYAPPDTTSCHFIQPYIRAMPYGTKEVGDTIKITPPYHIQFYTNNKYASTWAWDFGDGNTANTREPAHTYAAPGTYNVTLEVIHPHNLSSQVCTLNVSKNITIVDVTALEEAEAKETEYLGQNIPNPFSNTTVIPYYVPQGSMGFLQIHNSKGEFISEYALQQGNNRLEISMGSYKAGVYLYSIVIDNERKQTKRMVVE